MFLATIFYLWLYCERRIERWRYPGRFSMDCISFLPGGLVLKYTSTTLGRRDAEAEALRYVRKHTTIPVPRVYASVEGYGIRFLLMERAKGDCLEGAWDALDDKQRDAVAEQLRGYVAQLRALPPLYGGRVCAADGGALWDSRITSSGPIGPFDDEAAFNDFVVAKAEIFVDPSILPEVRAEMRDDHRIVFTHSDLAPRNILVKDGKVTSLVDWGESGWYPQHWELVKAMWCPMLRGKDLPWEDRVQAIFTEEDRRDWLVDRELSKHLVGGF